MPMAASTPTVVIRPQTGWIPLGLPELWRYRELVGFLAWRDVRVRYKQSALGAAWALLQPLLTLAVFTGLFGALLGPDRLPRVPGVSYAVSTFCALVPWQLFARAVSAGSDSLVVNQALVTKVYFPRLAVPIAPVLAALVDFALAFAVLIAMLAWAGIAPGAARARAAAARAPHRRGGARLHALARRRERALPRRAAGTSVSGAALDARDARRLRGALCAGRAAALGHARLRASTRWPASSRASAGPCSAAAEPPTLLLAGAAFTTLLVLASGLVVFRRLERRFADQV